MKKTLADYFKEYIKFENTTSPYEAINFILNNKNKNYFSRFFFDKTEKLVLEGHEKIRPFVRHKISSNVFFYNSVNINKKILICFCGNANRLMMPIPAFLQYIDERIYDVLVLVDPSKLCYHSGIPDFGFTLEESINNLSDIISTKKYEQITTFGTSGGGCASLYVGAYLNAKKAISVGACHPLDYEDTKLRLSEKNLTGSEFDKLLSMRRNEYQTNIKVIYSDRHDGDKKSAINFTKHLINVNLFPIDGESHNALEELRIKQKLKLLMDDLFN
jgi:hypothetical protein